jgi:nucleoside-diphosphate-sugar epimerase
MVYLSSVDVYGLVEDGRKLNEESHLAPVDFYSLSKQVSEFLLTKGCAVSGTLLTIFRLSGIYGPGDKDNSTIYKLVSSACDKKEIVIHGHGTVQRDFVYVADVCWLVRAALERNVAGIYNVATGKSYSIKTIAGILRELMPFDFSIRFREAENGISRAESLQFDVAKLQRGFPDIRLSDLRAGLSLYLAEA